MGLPACSAVPITCPQGDHKLDVCVPMCLPPTGTARPSLGTQLHCMSKTLKIKRITAIAETPVTFFCSNQEQQSQSFPQQPVLYLNQSSRRANSSGSQVVSEVGCDRLHVWVSWEPTGMGFSHPKSQSLGGRHSESCLTSKRHLNDSDRGIGRGSLAQGLHPWQNSISLIL